MDENEPLRGCPQNPEKAAGRGSVQAGRRPRKGHTAALFEEESQLRRILDSVQEAVVGMDAEGNLSHWNPSAERLFGYGPEEMIGQDFSVLLSDQDSARSYRRGFRQFTKREPEAAAGRTVELAASRKDGKKLPIEISLSSIRMQNRWTTIGIVRDISRRKRMIDSLRKSEEKYRLLVDNANEAILVAQDGQLKFTNPKAIELLGYSFEELTNRPFTEFIHPEDRALVVERHQKRLRGEDFPHVYPFRIVDNEGRIKWAEINAVRFSWEDRPATLNFISDITWRVHAEEELRKHRDRLEELVEERTAELQASIIRLEQEIRERKRAESDREALIDELEAKNKELERFTYTVSHDLKSPLMTIRGFLGRLVKDLEGRDEEKIKRGITCISSAAETMERLLGELLELSRLGHSLHPPARLQLVDIAHEAAGMVAGRLRDRGVALEIASDLGEVMGDRSRLLQVMQNLLDNAIKFLGEEPAPRVEIGVRRDGEESVFYIRDNGVGVDPEYQEKVFGLFDKLDQSSEGTGVGLAIVRRIIELHGGRIWVESEGRKRGSAFCFTLPGTRS
jgi:PAS domain S-box-containing protein